MEYPVPFLNLYTEVKAKPQFMEMDPSCERLRNSTSRPPVSVISVDLEPIKVTSDLALKIFVILFQFLASFQELKVSPSTYTAPLTEAEYFI